ncbi:MAG: patatin-like phospholipase family protein [Planctomycetota bacterium]
MTTGAQQREGRGELALVMSGGGARAAYQVGFLRALARERPDFAPDILTGVSAGAINAGFLAAQPGAFGIGIEALSDLWTGLQAEDVMDTRARRLGRRGLRWMLRLASGGRYRPEHLRGLVDTAPLRRMLERSLPEGGVARRIERGELKALAITATSYSTGQTVTFCEGRQVEDWARPGRRSRSCPITAEHVLASSALPLLFPAVRLEQGWFGDGGMRLTAPLAPAIHLGARRILAISTRFGRSDAEADEPVIDRYPPPARIAGLLLNAVFLDQLDADALRLRQTNRLLAGLPPADRGRLRPIELRVFRPSRDLGKLANEYEARLPRALRFFARGTGTLETRSNDLLSLIMFQGDYLTRLVELGEGDALANLDELLAFLG